MLRQIMMIGIFGLFICGSLQSVCAQLTSCRTMTSCSSTPSPTGCNQELHWTRCDGTHSTRFAACTNTGCIAGCECSCGTSGYSQAWEDTCIGAIRSITYDCNSCPGPVGGCNGPQDWVQFPSTGCASGFVSNGGICQRSQEYQNGCAYGYNSFTCSCKPPPPPPCIPECYEPSPSCPCWVPPDWSPGRVMGKPGLSCPPPATGAVAERRGSSPLSPDCECSLSPIIIDILGDGFALRDAANGVPFDFNGDGIIGGHLGWTVADSDDAWLVLDRDGNGTIDNGRELFGNATPQDDPPAGEKRQGFLALAEYDRPASGGNNDGKITNADAIFADLRLWQDTNHNGVSEASELHTFSELGLATLDLDYKESRQTDEFGNQFRYRAKVKDVHGAQLGRWAWDVFLVSSH